MRLGLSLKTVEALVSHELFEGMGELPCIVVVGVIGGMRPSGVVRNAVGHGDDWRVDWRLVLAGERREDTDSPGLASTPGWR